MRPDPAGLGRLHDANHAPILDAQPLLLVARGAGGAHAHLAAALGKPAWVLVTAVPDWRWQLNRTGSPWYPDIRLYRQRPGEDGWTASLQRVRGDLAKRLA